MVMCSDPRTASGTPEAPQAPLLAAHCFTQVNKSNAEDHPGSKKFSKNIPTSCSVQYTLLLTYWLVMDVC